MASAEITKSRRKLEAWAASRALDAIAVPLLAKHGVVEAYRVAIEQSK